MTAEIIIIIFLILIGVALLMAEIFLLPGITIAGVAGCLTMIGSIVYAFYYIGNTAGYLTITANVAIFVLTLIILIKSKALDHIALKTDITSTVIDKDEFKGLKIGDKGITISRLNPIGKAEFGTQIVEAKSFTGEYIDEGQAIEIVRIDNSNILVQSIDSN